MTDVVVVGAGPIGLATAWRSAQRGLAVTVHDPDLDDSGAWYAAAGILAPVSEETVGEHELTGLLVESASVWPGFAADLESATGLDIGYRTEGTLMVGLTADDETEVRRLRDYQTALGLPAHPQTAAPTERESASPRRSPELYSGIVGPPTIPRGRRIL